MGGRVSSVAGIPSPSRTFFVAAAAGGIWKTTNAGTTFRPVFENEKCVSMGELAIAPSDTMQVWAGTGEEDSRNTISPGCGIFKSIDGGLTWKRMGLEKSGAIGRIVVHPTNPNIVYVAALGQPWSANPERGLYKTTDGGQTWQLVKFVSPQAGSVVPQSNARSTHREGSRALLRGQERDDCRRKARGRWRRRHREIARHRRAGARRGRLACRVPLQARAPHHARRTKRRSDCGRRRRPNARRSRGVGCCGRPALHTSRGLLTVTASREVEFAPKDAPLRDDVRTLGAIVGDVLREQCGDAFFELVERARHAAIASADDELHALVRGLPTRDAETLIRAFATYFEVVNLAERIHRIRRRRDYLRSASDPQEGSLKATVGRLAAASIPPPQIAALLQRLRIEPVFTAHPTEATRRTLLEKEQVNGRLLVERLDPSRTPDEERAALARIREEVTITWQTDPQPSARPTVMDELENVLFYLTDVVYRIVPPFYEELEQAVPNVYDIQVPARPVLRFGSWVGGDMDGNPHAGAETLRSALARQPALVGELYRREAAALARRLSQSGARTGVSDAVRERVATYGAQFPKTLAAIPTRYHDMPYRLLLSLMAARLDATRRDESPSNGYPTAAELERDLGVVIASLRAHRGEHAGLFAVQRLLRRVETFGFHLATIDVRQHAHVHRDVLATLLGDPDWSTRAPADRLARLRRALEQGEKPPGGASPDTPATRTLEGIKAIAQCRARFGPDAVGPYIISMTQGADDVLAVLLLGRWGGLAQPGTKHIALDVAPLFETVADLEDSPPALAALPADPYYRAHLARSEEHTSELQSQSNLVCRLLLEK